MLGKLLTTIVVLSVFIFVSTLQATNYYVDGTNGNDSNNGLTPATAWKTLSKINNDSSFTSGDIIAIRDSIRYEGGIFFTASGTNGSHIKITNWYGSASERKPVIKASNTVTNFVNVTGNIWRASYVPLTSQINQVWFEGNKDDATQTVWGVKETSVGNLNTDYEWYWSSNELYIYSTSDPDTRYDYVEADCQTAWNKIYAIFCQGNYVTIENLDVRYANMGGIRLGNESVTGDIVQNCKTSFTGLRSTESAHGILVYNGNNINLRNNQCFENSNHGIYVFANNTSNTSKYVIIDSNVVYNNKHSQIDINTNEGHLDSTIIKYNKIFCTSSFQPISSYVDGIFMGGQFSNGSNKNVFVIGNLIYNIRGREIDIDGGGTVKDIHIYNNTFFNDLTSAIRIPDWMVYIVNGLNSVDFRNNIVVSTGNKKLLRVSNIANKNLDHNLYYWDNISNPFYLNDNISTLSSWQNLTGQDSHSFNSNPNFINAPSNFKINSGNAIDNGMEILISQEDFDGTNRPQGNHYDIGAYEKIQNGGDTTPPTIISANLTSSETLVITFSEAIQQIGAETSANYNINNGIIVSSAVLSQDKKEVTLTTSSHTNGQSYILTVSNIIDLAGNLISPTGNTAGYSFFSDSTPPELVGAALSGTNTVLVTFSEEMDSLTVLDKNNYLINNEITINSVVVLCDSKRVILSTSDHVFGSSYDITVNNVKDKAGNLIDQDKKSLSYLATEKINYDILQAAGQWYQNFTPRNAIDGNPDTTSNSRWCGVVNLPDSLVFDLGNIKNIEETHFSFYRWNQGRIYNYSIMTSTDRTHWTEVVKNSTSAPLEWTIDIFSQVKARYIKLVVLRSNESQFAGLWEAEILGPENVTGIENGNEMPSEFKLEQNYPNPFNPTTTINFDLPSDQHVRINIYNTLGQLVKSLVNQFYTSGNHSVSFNASGLPSGIYIYSLESKSFSASKKMLLLK